LNDLSILVYSSIFDQWGLHGGRRTASLDFILTSRLIPYADEITGDYQCGIQRNMSTTHQIFHICHILEKKWEYNGTVHQLFIDLKKVSKWILGRGCGVD
jgi:hypothetical protein